MLLALTSKKKLITDSANFIVNVLFVEPHSCPVAVVLAGGHARALLIIESLHRIQTADSIESLGKMGGLNSGEVDQHCGMAPCRI